MSRLSGIVIRSHLAKLQHVAYQTFGRYARSWYLIVNSHSHLLFIVYILYVNVFNSLGVRWELWGTKHSDHSDESGCDYIACVNKELKDVEFVFDALHILMVLLCYTLHILMVLLCYALHILMVLLCYALHILMVLLCYALHILMVLLCSISCIHEYLMAEPGSIPFLQFNSNSDKSNSNPIPTLVPNPFKFRRWRFHSNSTIHISRQRSVPRDRHYIWSQVQVRFGL